MHKQGPSENPRSRATVVLHHACGAASHYDWMIEDPDQPAGKGLLCTWRIDAPPRDWPRSGEDGGRVMLTRLGDHRRAYLTYEGDIGGGRGEVRRVDAGRVEVIERTAAAATLDVTLTGYAGRITLRRESGDAWVMIVGEGV